MFVDMCCKVRKTLFEVFGVPVKLDIRHWMARWDDILVDPKSPEAAIFRGMMSRAVLMAPTNVCNKKREELALQMQHPLTVKLVLKKCDKAAPNPEKLEATVKAIVMCTLRRDANKVALLNTLTDDDCAKDAVRMTFKDNRAAHQRFIEQLKHV